MVRVTKRLRSLVKYEDEARQQGFKLIAGIDEAGRGPLAGPVTAGACIIPEGKYFKGINDSKLLNALQREELFKKITEDSDVIFGVGIVDHRTIDEINIYQATVKAMLQAIENLRLKPDFLLVDGLKLHHHEIPSIKIIKGDQLSQSIMAAAIIAKVTRDRMMEEYDKEWPVYGFKHHKGYSTKKHFDALNQYGPSPIHRNFKPIKLLKGAAEEESQLLLF
ncbi:MAG: ribonuclease HII [Parachlamydiaceae bacterium]